jgi:hypothetical protein
MHTQSVRRTNMYLSEVQQQPSMPGPRSTGAPGATSCGASSIATSTSVLWFLLARPSTQKGLYVTAFDRSDRPSFKGRVDVIAQLSVFLGLLSSHALASSRNGACALRGSTQAPQLRSTPSLTHTLRRPSFVGKVRRYSRSLGSRRRTSSTIRLCRLRPHRETVRRSLDDKIRMSRQRRNPPLTSLGSRGPLPLKRFPPLPPKTAAAPARRSYSRRSGLDIYW